MLGTVRSRPRHGTVFFWISSRSPAMPLLHNWKRRKQDWLTHMRGERLRPYRLVVAFMRIAAKRNSRRPRGCHHKRAKKNSRRDYRRSTVADCTISACNIRRLQPLQYRGKKKGGGNETRITISSSNPRLIDHLDNFSGCRWADGKCLRVATSLSSSSLSLYATYIQLRDNSIQKVRWILVNFVRVDN